MKILNTVALSLLSILLTIPAAAQSTSTTTLGSAADVTGTWDASVTTAQGQTIPSQVKLKKEGDKIVGTLSSQMGEAPVTAEVKGKDLTIWFNFQGQNGPMAIELAGTVNGDAIKGTMAVGGQPTGEWTATRAKDAKDAKDGKEPAKEQPAAAGKSDLSGTYNVTVELPNMTANPTVVLKQDGDKLSGDYVSAQYGKFPVTGTIKGSDLSFSFPMNVEGNALNVTYAGTVDKDGTLKGSVTYGDMMSGTFSAVRKK
jgi:hypothetical protein